MEWIWLTSLAAVTLHVPEGLGGEFRYWQDRPRGYVEEDARPFCPGEGRTVTEWRL